MKDDNNKLTNFVIFKDKKRLEIVDDIIINGSGYSNMSLERRERERNKYKQHKDNWVGVNVLSENLFIREVM
jgi:hypothetical protein|tara:strand:+ start:366 stop:581 length:216 start_codon:yes stop_codon:yes gene_type:complete